MNYVIIWTIVLFKKYTLYQLYKNFDFSAKLCVRAVFLKHAQMCREFAATYHIKHKAIFDILC